MRVRAIDDVSGEPVPEFNVRLGRCQPHDMRDGDLPAGGILSSLIDPGVNVHGTTKELLLEGLIPHTAYSLVVSADGYETATVLRIRATVDAGLTDVRLIPLEDSDRP